MRDLSKNKDGDQCYNRRKRKNIGVYVLLKNRVLHICPHGIFFFFMLGVDKSKTNCLEEVHTRRHTHTHTHTQSTDLHHRDLQR